MEIRFSMSWPMAQMLFVDYTYLSQHSVLWPSSLRWHLEWHWGEAVALCQWNWFSHWLLHSWQIWISWCFLLLLVLSTVSGTTAERNLLAKVFRCCVLLSHHPLLLDYHGLCPVLSNLHVYTFVNFASLLLKVQTICGHRRVVGQLCTSAVCFHDGLRFASVARSRLFWSLH